MKRSIDRIQAVYQGESWHGPNIKEVLDQIDAAKASVRITPSAHSIVELVQHLLAWRNFTLEMLRGNVAFRIDVEAAEDWPAYPNGVSESEWTDIQLALERNQTELVQAMKDFDQDKLHEKVGHRSFTFSEISSFIIDHDLWHTGQVAMLKRLAISN